MTQFQHGKKGIFKIFNIDSHSYIVLMRHNTVGMITTLIISFSVIDKPNKQVVSVTFDDIQDMFNFRDDVCSALLEDNLSINDITKVLDSVSEEQNQD